MAKKVAKKSDDATVPAIDPVPAAAPTTTVKPRATSVPRAAKQVAASVAPSVTDEMIAERAYHMWRNGADGDHVGHWMAAERELRSGR